MTPTTAWPFGDDADQGDPLTAHRIAVTCSHPGWRYLVAFDRASEARPTDAEVAMLASYLEEYKSRWYNNSYLAKLGQRPLDVDGGANGVVFHKWGVDDWGYRRQSYTTGPLFWPGPQSLRDWYRERGEADLPPMSLAALMDHIHAFGDKPNSKWEAWKAAHRDVFGA